MKKKSTAIVKIEAEYKKIIDLQPEPPPRWVIAAGSRVGLLWGDFVDDFRRAPIPADWNKKGCAVACGTADELSWRDIKLNYLNALDMASQPYKDGRHAPRRQARRREARARCVPRLLREVPVLRRVLSRVRGLAREELQGRVPRRRRAARRADALEQRARRPPAAASHRRSRVAPRTPGGREARDHACNHHRTTAPNH